MAIGATLYDLRYDLLAETNQSLNPAHGTNIQAQYNHQLKRTQEEQWRMFAWPHLRLFKDVTLNAGQRYYDYPLGLPFDAIDRVWRKESVDWFTVDYGISPSTYSVFGGEDTRQWPIRRWRNVPSYNANTQITTPAAQFEVWPTPSQSGAIRVEGQAPLNALVSDTDTCIIDSNLIVLFAAAELLAAQKSEGAALKLQKAQQYQRKLMSQLGSVKRRMRSLSHDGGTMGAPGSSPRPTPYLDYIPMNG